MRFNARVHQIRTRRIGVGWTHALGRRMEALEPGVVTVEYAIVVALVAIAAMGAVQAFGTGVAHVFANLLGHITGMG